MVLELNTKTGEVIKLSSDNVYQHSVLINKLIVYLSEELLSNDILVAIFGKNNAVSNEFEAVTNNIPFFKKPKTDLSSGEEIENEWQYELTIPASVLKQSGTHAVSLAIKYCINPYLPVEDRLYKVKTTAVTTFMVDGSAQVIADEIIPASVGEALIGDILDLQAEQDTQDARATGIENDLGVVEQLPNAIPIISRGNVVNAIGWIVENMGDVSGAISRRKQEFTASEFVGGKLTLSLVGLEMDLKTITPYIYRYVDNDYEKISDEVIINTTNEALIIDSGQGFDGFVIIDSKPNKEANNGNT